MDRKLMEAGLAARRAVLGDEVVDRVKNADSFNQPFQELVSECCWGVLDRRQAHAARAQFSISA